MDSSERLVEQYLNSLGIGAVVYEPDGNIPPDFSVAGSIAVEVRRLNQNYESPDGSRQGLEQLSIPLWNRFKSFLPSLGPSLEGECWYVGVDLQRPLAEWSAIESALRTRLRAFMAQSMRRETTISICTNLRIDLFRAGKDHGSFFVLGASSDNDSGGFVMGELERNLRLCIAEKERKIEPYRNRYSKWWLVLPDHINYAIQDDEHEHFRSEIMPCIAHRFDRIILLDPRDPSRAIEA